MKRIVIIQPNEFVLFLYFYEAENKELLIEAKYVGKHIGGTYSVKKHSAHIPQGLPHYHVFCRQNQVAAVNIDGTAHDKSHKKQIPKTAADYLRGVGIPIPRSNILEVLDPLALNGNFVIYGQINNEEFETITLVEVNI